MRGHWISGTRKLNRHYQSGNGVDSYKTVVFDNMLYGLNGIEYTKTAETYNDNSGTFDIFYKVDENNLIVAPCYEIFDTENDPYTVESKDILRGGVEVSTQGWKFNVYAESATDNIKNYGLIEALPHWVYYDVIIWFGARSASSVFWGIATQLDSTKNPNGIAMTDTIECIPGITGTDYGYRLNATPGVINSFYFSNAYGHKVVKVLVPVFEVISYSGNYDAIALTDESRADWIGDLTLKVRVKKKNNIQRIPSLDRTRNYAEGSSPLSYWKASIAECYNVIKNDKMYYMCNLYASEEGGIRSRLRNGVVTYPFPCHQLFENTRRQNSRGEWIYVRLDHLIQKDVVLIDYVINNELFPEWEAAAN